MATDIKPIRTEADYEAAMAEVEKLWGAKLGTPKGDRLDVLATLIDSYEEKHFPIEAPDPIEAILFRMEQQGLDRKDLEPMIGGSGRVSEVLDKKRPLSISMIRRIHRKMGIPAEVLIQPSTAIKKKATPTAPARVKRKTHVRATSARSSASSTRTSNS